MAFPNPFASFQPKKKGVYLGGEFTVWEPLQKYKAEEEYGSCQRLKGGEVAAIETKTRVPVVSLEQVYGDLFKRVWKKAQTPTAPAQRNLLAQTRAATQPVTRLAQGNYVRQVAPTEMLGINGFAANDVSHLRDLANDWQLHQGLKRCTAYTFRGDGRDPAAIKSADGFHPPSTRTDDYYIKGAVYEQFCGYMMRRFNMNLKATMSPDEFLAVVRQSANVPGAMETLSFYSSWRALVKSEELHLGRMLADECLKGFISTTKVTSVAKGFACRGRTQGWVFCTAVNGGFVVPNRQATQWTNVFGEQEIAKVGPITWNGIVAARAVKNNMFEGDMYFRKGFESIDSKSFEQIYKLLSGMKQVAVGTN